MDLGYIWNHFILRYISFVVVTALLWIYYFYLHYTKQTKRSEAIKKYAFIVCASFVALIGAEQVKWSIILDSIWISLIGAGFLLFPVADWYTTKKALSNGAREANPAMNFIINKFGIDKILFVTVPVVGYIVMDLLSSREITATFIVFTLIYAFVVANNTLIVRKQNK